MKATGAPHLWPCVSAQGAVLSRFAKITDVRSIMETVRMLKKVLRVQNCAAIICEVNDEPEKCDTTMMHFSRTPRVSLPFRFYATSKENTE